MSHTYPHLNHMIPTGNLLLKSVFIRYTWRIGRRQAFDQRETPRPDSPVEAEKAGYPTCAAANLAKATDLVQGQADVVAGYFSVQGNARKKYDHGNQTAYSRSASLFS